MMPGGKHNCAFHCAVRQHKLAQPGSIRLLQKGHPEFSYAPWQNLYFRSGAEMALIYKGNPKALCLY
jgi:choline-glycine betaine transporter